MKYLISCDWGTSSFRIYLLNAANGNIMHMNSSDEGMARIFSMWQLSESKDPQFRQAFYLDIIAQHIRVLEQLFGISLAGVPVYISGMASSSIGFYELPYAKLPVKLAYNELTIGVIKAYDDFLHDVTVISGVRSDNDVMRGEETQLLGCLPEVSAEKLNLFILPGTHSKHIYLNKVQIAGFKTYMTGEFFELLSKRSVLKSSVEPSGSLSDDGYKDRFCEGLNQAVIGNFLNIAFRVRTNKLFDKMSSKENYAYLSGLLIGTEVKELRSAHAERINLLCGSNLQQYYIAALDYFGLKNITTTFDAKWIDQAAARAHYKLFKTSEI